MSKQLILQTNPKIEFQIHENGFRLIDEQIEKNTGFYNYNDLQDINLEKPWYPSVVKWLRVFTWILNGVPFFPDAESCKKAKLIFHVNKNKHCIWLTDSTMAKKAKHIKALIEKKLTNSAFTN